MNKLIQAIKNKSSYLCIGLDASPIYWPQDIPSNVQGLEHFCKSIIEATYEYAIAYKLNLAFFEVWGVEGLETMTRVLEFIPKEIFTIADAKRSDIGHSAYFYAKTFFEMYRFDSITVNPYMGKDSVEPFLEYKDKTIFLLGLTSNEGANDFQLSGNPPLYEQVIRKSMLWNVHNNIGFVMGATRPDAIQTLRNIFPKAPLLIPGIGAQSGDLYKTLQNAYSPNAPILITISRAILYADTTKNFLQKARQKALNYYQEISQIIHELSVS
jgi:orotidine-5'-phosphate decarboxylase